MKPLFAALALLLFNFSFSQTLFPGMEPPALQVGTWIKGKPVHSFNEDSIYVVEFWATWCGPCKQSIPHLTELAKKYPQTNIIGVSVAEANSENVRPFVDEMGERMNYTVAIDKQESATAKEGFMLKNWFVAAGLTGIPAAFVIQKNRITWIGYPTQLDDVLESINNGKWDDKEFATKWKKEKDDQKEIQLQGQRKNDKIKELAKAGKKEEFYEALTEQLWFQMSNHNYGTVNEYIWVYIADPAGTRISNEIKDYGFGVRWMEKLTSIPEGKIHAFFDTLAWCYYRSGNKAKAIETEKLALMMIPPGNPAKAQYENSLQTFEDGNAR